MRPELSSTVSIANVYEFIENTGPVASDTFAEWVIRFVRFLGLHHIPAAS